MYWLSKDSSSLLQKTLLKFLQTWQGNFSNAFLKRVFNNGGSLFEWNSCSQTSASIDAKRSCHMQKESSSDHDMLQRKHILQQTKESLHQRETNMYLDSPLKVRHFYVLVSDGPFFVVAKNVIEVLAKLERHFFECGFFTSFQQWWPAASME
jgi:hypothetical protein